MIAGFVIMLFAGALGLVAWGAFHIQANFFLKATHQGNAKRRQIALTFDDGPHPLYTPQVLELLHRHHAKATFFCVGKNVIKHPEIVKQIQETGHTVGNHSYTHSATIDFHGKNSWLNELRRADTAIEQVIGYRPTLFRPPYGVTTPHLAAAIHRSGHHVVGWRVRPYDTVQRRSTAQIVHTVLRQVKPGAIILLHDTHNRMAPALEQLLPELQRRGYTCVTVAQLINQDAYAET